MKSIYFFIGMIGASFISVYSQSDCRLALGELTPIIERYNPFFGDHKWIPETRMELATLDNSRIVIITQDGCKRHHIHIDLIIDTRAVVAVDSFWISEVKGLLHKVYFDQTVYKSFQATFEDQFEFHFLRYGINEEFNFPIGTRNAICQVKYDREYGAKISVELIEFIFKEKIQKREQGVSKAKDDGWKGIRPE